MMIKNNSEIGQLKKVILHEPGMELEHLTPDLLNELLFDDIPWLEEAITEHQYFKKILEDNGVEVVYLVDLVVESLITDNVLIQFINQFINESNINNQNLEKRVKKYLLKLNKKDMVLQMMAGITKDKIGNHKNKSLKEMVSKYPFITNPMPNLYFTRDPFFIIYDGVSINKMKSDVRNRESLFGQYIFDYHPKYKTTKRFYNRDDFNSIEGGDILVVNNETILIGLSLRTKADAIEKLSKELFKQTNCRRIVVIDVPKERKFMHLDTVLTQVDHDKFLAHHDFIKKVDAYIISKNESKSNDIKLKITHVHDRLAKIFTKILNKKITLLPCGGDDKIASDREQWSDGANTLTIKPGVVIVYDRNIVTNKILTDAGIKVIPMKSSELSRGRGGPRCMSMPIAREDI